MGLDSFWVHPDDDGREHPTFDPPLDLVGGMFSGNGRGSFRGKVYADFIMTVTGCSLYQERITNDIVCHMARKLEEYIDQAASGVTDPPEDVEDDCDDVSAMFTAYAEAGFELRGWW